MTVLGDLPGSLWKYYEAGGLVMHPITLCSLVALTVIVYKLIVLRGARAGTAALTRRVRAALLDGRIGEALDACRADDRPVALTLRAGLLKHGAPRDEIERAMESAALAVISHLERYQGLLAGITGFTPLLGFFGTVVGMILAFDTVAEQGLSNPGLVARGLSTALYTTAWGLIVAFVTKPFHDFFAGRIAACGRDMELAANVLLETFSEMERMGSRA